MFQRSSWNGAGSALGCAGGRGQGRDGESCPVPYSPLIPRAARSRSSTGRRQRKHMCRRLEEPIAALWGGCLAAPRCCGHGGPGEPKRPSASTSASGACREQGRSRGSQPLPAARGRPGASWLAEGEQELRPPPRHDELREEILIARAVCPEVALGDHQLICPPALCFRAGPFLSSPCSGWAANMVLRAELQPAGNVSSVVTAQGCAVSLTQAMHSVCDSRGQLPADGEGGTWWEQGEHSQNETQASALLLHPRGTTCPLVPIPASWSCSTWGCWAQLSSSFPKNHPAGAGVSWEQLNPADICLCKEPPARRNESCFLPGSSRTLAEISRHPCSGLLGKSYFDHR